MTTLFIVLAVLDLPVLLLIVAANLAELKRWKSGGAGG